eukprot:EG_transcript_22437
MAPLTADRLSAAAARSGPRPIPVPEARVIAAYREATTPESCSGLSDCSSERSQSTSSASPGLGPSAPFVHNPYSFGAAWGAAADGDGASSAPSRDATDVGSDAGRLSPLSSPPATPATRSSPFPAPAAFPWAVPPARLPRPARRSSWAGPPDPRQEFKDLIFQRAAASLQRPLYVR